MLTLTVVNLMLGTMGEKPLNSLTDTHAMLAACTSGLDEANRRIQAEGWWFNMELITLTPSLIDGSLNLANDVLEVHTSKANYVKRGTRVYNLDGGTYVFTIPEKVEVLRLVPFDSIPEVAASYIAMVAIRKFQTDYDGDTAKTRDIEKEVERTQMECNAEHTRCRKVNLLDSNSRLQRLKQVTNGARRYIYR